MSIKVVSFDVDGTLVDTRYNDLVWLEGVPAMYAQRHSVSLSEAKEKVIGEYEKVGADDLRWYDTDSWMRHFNLGASMSVVLDKYVPQIKVHPEVDEVLRELGRRFPIIIITTMPRDFLEVKMRLLGAHNFSATFSAVSDFKGFKTSHLYLEVCKKLCIAPGELLHIGDDRELDYVKACEAGIKAVHIDRQGNGLPDTITNLSQLLDMPLLRP